MYSVLNLRAGTEPVLSFVWRIEEGGRTARNEREGVVRQDGRDGRRVWRCEVVFGAGVLSLTLWRCVGDVVLCVAMWRFVGHRASVFGAVALRLVL